MRLNLGCSDRHFPGFINVDLCEPAEVIANLTKRWPWEDNSIEEIRAWDLIEHLPDRNHTMNEAFRVLRPGGRFDIEVPTTDGRGVFTFTGTAWPDIEELLKSEPFLREGVMKIDSHSVWRACELAK